MTDQHHVGKLAPFHFVDDVENVGVETDRGRQQVRTLASPVSVGVDHVVAGAGEQPHHALPAPGTVPSAVN